MKKKIWLLALMAIVLLSGSSAWADSEFYVIVAGPTVVGTKITHVPYEITSSGFYYLTGNLGYGGADNAITISANDVTLDLMGFSLTNTGVMGSTKGIYMSERANVEIRNGQCAAFRPVCMGMVQIATNTASSMSEPPITVTGSLWLAKTT